MVIYLPKILCNFHFTLSIQYNKIHLEVWEIAKYTIRYEATQQKNTNVPISKNSMLAISLFINYKLLIMG